MRQELDFIPLNDGMMADSRYIVHDRSCSEPSTDNNLPNPCNATGRTDEVRREWLRNLPKVMGGKY